MRHALALSRWLLIAVFSTLYVWLAYSTTAKGEPSTLGAALAILPVALFALILAWKSRHRALAVGLWVAVVAVLLLAWPTLEQGFAWVYFIQHAGIFTLLGIAFGRTLSAAETPMITRFAYLVHGDALPPEIARYTRSVTLLWTLFFALMAGASALLFGLGELAEWSLFANFLTPVLVALTFAGEYLVRLIVLPAEVRTGLLESIRASVAAARGSAS